MLSKNTKKYTYLGIVCLGLVSILVIILHGNGELHQLLFHLKESLTKGEQLRDSILAYGSLAPAIFVFIQILQVVFAPVPGEASGLLGGYLFGAWPGLLYSTIGLTLGSWIAFAVGRFLGKLFPHKIQETKVYGQFNHLVYKGGFVIPFILFIIPGFPKDSLSYLLGLSRMPLKVFLFVTAVGRIPGTLMLSLQGAEVYQGNYTKFLILLLVTGFVSIPFYLYRKQIMHRLQVYNTLLDTSASNDSPPKTDD
jgi:uncharacterized membrane protein YdjX (TVP38/TMEM64 family)